MTTVTDRFFTPKIENELLNFSQEDLSNNPTKIYDFELTEQQFRVEKNHSNITKISPYKIITKITDENWIQAIWASQLVHAQKMILIYLFGKIDLNTNFIHAIERTSISEILEHTELAKSTVINGIQKLRRENYLKFENFNPSLNVDYNFSYKVTAKLFDNYFKTNIGA